MELEKEIKQVKKFESPYHKLAINLIYSGNWLNGLQLNLLKPFNITPQQYNLLRILRGQHPQPATVNLIIDRMLDKMSNASRLVERLRVKGLLERKPCPNDRRQVDVLITEKGLNLLKLVDKEQEKFYANLKTLNTREAETLNKLLDKLRG